MATQKSKKRVRDYKAEPLSLPDVLSISDASGLYNLSNTVIPKIRKAALDIRLKPNHHIDAARFKTVCATSDLHSDYRNFLNYLQKLKFIELPYNVDIYDPGQIYDPQIIINTQWNLENTLLVILGDLVDGKRFISVNDSQGSFELYIHMFLYNLRLKALEKGSEVLFIIGNHDMATVINTNNDIMYENYVTDEAKRFFGGDRLMRGKCLENFYLLSPYLFLTIDKETVPEIYMVHGGFHQVNFNPYAGPEFEDNLSQLDKKFPQIEQDQLRDFLIASENDMAKFMTLIHLSDVNDILAEIRYKKNAPLDFLDILEENQRKLNSYVVTDNGFTDEVIKNPDLTYSDNIITSPLWSRFYMEALGRGYETKMCKHIRNNAQMRNKTVIVGHCPTNFQEFDEKKQDGGIDVGDEYHKCIDPNDNTGCIMSICDMDKETKIIFVDTAMSCAFRRSLDPALEKARDSEIIVLRHLSDDDEHGRYFNEMKRIRTDNTQYIIYPLRESFEWRPALMSGGRKNKTVRRRKSRTKSKTRTKK